MDGAMIPPSQVAKVIVAKGAPGICTENALRSASLRWPGWRTGAGRKLIRNSPAETPRAQRAR